MKLRIALIAKLFAPVSKSSTGGTETFVYNLARELDKRKHKVTVFATGDSEIEGLKIKPVVEESTWAKFQRNHDQSENMFLGRKFMSEEFWGYLRILFYLKNHQDQFDIVHNNSFNFLFLSLHPLFTDLPLVSTMHTPENPETIKIINDLVGKGNLKSSFVSVSKNQKELIRDFKISFINYNGIDENRFSFSVGGGKFLIWLGRIVPEKGLEKAIEVAIKTNMNLKIAGSIADRGLFEKQIKPIISRQKNIIYLGEELGQNLVKLYQEAKILLFPIDWDEPFGLVMIEAMACGTPVVAFDRGSVPEIIKDGKTGFICPPDDIEAMVKAVKKIYEMPEEEYRKMRLACRSHVEENFTVEKMVDGYEKVYQKVIEDWRKKK